MGVGGVGQGIFAVDQDVQIAGGDPLEQLAAAAEQLVAVGDVVGQAGAGQGERAVRGQETRVEVGDRAARLAVAHQVAAPAQGGQ